MTKRLFKNLVLLGFGLTLSSPSYGGMKAHRKSKMNTIKEDSAKINGSKSLKKQAFSSKES
jgi:hypothetical protein